MKERSRKRRVRRWLGQILVLALLFVAFWVPRVTVLDQFMTVDEHKWAIRSANFYVALSERNFVRTYQREHPGVTAMWAGSGGLLWRFPDYLDTGVEQIDNPVDYEPLLQEHGHRAVELLAAGRFFAVAANAIALLVAFVLARQLIGFLPALIGFLLIAFDPFYTAHSHLLHLDGMLSSFMFLSLLAFLAYLSHRRFPYLLLSGIAAGLAWLTKSPGFFLGPVVGLLALIDWWGGASTAGDRRLLRSLGKYSGILVVWGAIGMLVFVILWPAMWVAPVESLSEIFEAALRHADRGHPNQFFFNGMLVRGDNLNGALTYFYPITYLWRTTPVVLVGLVAAVAMFVTRRGLLAQTQIRRTVIGLMLFAAVFTILMDLGAQKFDRYILPVYAPLDLVAAVGWMAVVTWISTKVGLLKPYFISLALAGIVLVQAVGILQLHPYYLSYYNPLLGGSARAPEVMMIGWGEGLDQAARYLNQKPEADQLRVASWYRPTFSYFFSGHTDYISTGHINEEQLERLLELDYAVIYIHQWQRQLPRPLLEYLAQQVPERSIWINGLEYARVYKLNGNHEAD